MNTADIITAVGGALGVLLPFAIPIGRFLYPYLAQRFLPGNVRAAIDQTVNTVVHGVEQSMADSAGPDKKAAAVSAITNILKHEHVKASPDLVNFAIEEAVLLLNGKASDTEDPQPMGFQSSNGSNV